MTFTVGQRVWWKSTENTVKRGTVKIIEDSPGVLPDDDPDLLYLNAEQLKPQESGVFADVDEAAYHSDRGSLSQSGAKLLLPPSCPAKYRHVMDHGQEYKPAFTFGSLAHKLVLGEGAKIVEIDANDYRTKAAQQLRDNAIALGEIPALPSELAKARNMAKAIQEHATAGPLFADGAAELAMYANDPDTGVQLRGRMDWFSNGITTGLGDRPVIVDYKTAADASPDGLPRAVANYGYAMQFAWYVTLATLLGVENPVFLFVFQEKDPPYLVSVVELDAEAYEYGRAQMKQAIAIYAECRDTGTWPGYSDHITSISLPGWAIRSNQPTIGELLEVQ